MASKFDLEMQSPCAVDQLRRAKSEVTNPTNHGPLAWFTRRTAYGQGLVRHFEIKKRRCLFGRTCRTPDRDQAARLRERRGAG
jgi:hypothetical protein